MHLCNIRIIYNKTKENKKDHLLRAILIPFLKVLCLYCICVGGHVCQMPVLAHTWGCNYRCMCMNISKGPLMQLQCLCVACSCKVQSKTILFFFLTPQLNWIMCPFKSDSSHLFFCTFSIDQRPVWNFIASLLIAFLRFISFVTTLGSVYRGTVSWKDSSDGNPNQFIRSCLTESLLTARLKTWGGSGDWQGSWNHYAEIWDRILALGSHSRPEAS